MFFSISLLLAATICHSQLMNQFIEGTGPNGEDLWNSTSDFTPTYPNNSKYFSSDYGTIKLGQIMSIEFDFLFHGRSGSEAACPSLREENFFRIGYSGLFSDSCSGGGSHYPSLSLAPICSGEVLQIGFTTEMGCPDTMLLTDYGQDSLSTTQSHHIIIRLDNTMATVEISGGGQPNYIATKERTPTKESWLGTEVPVWFMSNKRSGEYNLGNATLSNIKIISNIFETTEPTKDPTSAPTKTTDNPTAAPSSLPTQYPSAQLMNQFIEGTGSNGENLWNSTSDFMPTYPNNSKYFSSDYGTIKLGQIMSIEFDFLFHGRSGSEIACPSLREENFFRIGFSGLFTDTCAGGGSHYPSLSLAPLCQGEVLQVGFTTETSCPDTMLLTDYGQGSLSTTQSHHIKITLDNTLATVEITGGGQPNYIATKDRTPTSESWLGISVPVWFMSNKRAGEFNLGNATLSNIKIVSDVFVPSTDNPTVNPSNPTTAPSEFPTASPTATPSQPIANLTELKDEATTTEVADIVGATEGAEEKDVHKNKFVIALSILCGVSFICLLCIWVYFCWVRRRKQHIVVAHQQQHAQQISATVSSQPSTKELFVANDGTVTAITMTQYSQASSNKALSIEDMYGVTGGNEPTPIEPMSIVTDDV